MKRYNPQIKTAFNKICTDKKLLSLCDLGYLKSPREGIYCATNKVLPVLKEAGFPINTLPDEPVGNGDINELNNTEAFIRLLKKEKYTTLLFCDFKYIIPDALMVKIDKENRKYKLTFLEIETKKPDWENYIENKRDNYLKLAKDIRFFNYWSEICPLLGLPQPKIDKLHYSVYFIGNIKCDFGKGFSFIEK